MRLSLFLLLSVTLLGVAVASSPFQKRITQGSDLPGRPNNDTKLDKQMQGYAFPDPDLIRKPDPSGSMNCNLRVEFDNVSTQDRLQICFALLPLTLTCLTVQISIKLYPSSSQSRCTAGPYRYAQLIVPYDEHSQSYNFSRSAETSGDQYYE